MNNIGCKNTPKQSNKKGKTLKNLLPKERRNLNILDADLCMKKKFWFHISNFSFFLCTHIGKRTAAGHMPAAPTWVVLLPNQTLATQIAWVIFNILFDAKPFANNHKELIAFSVEHPCWLLRQIKTTNFTGQDNCIFG